MARNGGIIGLANIPTAFVAGGVWSLQDVSSNLTGGDPHWNSVSVLIQPSADAAASDLSLAAHTVTEVGNADVSSAQSKFDGYSIALDGTGDWLTVPADADFDFGSGDFTIEMFIRLGATTNYQGLAGSDGYYTSGKNGNWVLSTLTSGQNLNFQTYDAQAAGVGTAGTFAFAQDTWYYVAAVRISGAITLYVNGIAVGSGTNDKTLEDGADGGLSFGEGLSGNNDFNGYLDCIRITKGVGREITPATAPTAAFPTNIGEAAAWPAPPYNIESIVVASGGGGGRGGSHGAAGGGAGGYRSSVSSESSGGGASVEAVLLVEVRTDYTVTIGAGGAGTSVLNANGGSGNNSVLSTVTSIGGGGGQGYVGSAGGTAPSGGSGGGGGAENGSGGSGTANQGYAGGNGLGASNYPGGGGGGAGAVGATAASTTAKGGAGGVGVQSNIDGNNYYYAGGGGGGGFTSGAGGGNGGLGGGGGGSTKTGAGGTGGGSALNSGIAGSTGSTGANGGAGGANTGGGAGSGDTEHSGATGNGGSGIVILRYLGGQKGSGGTITSSGGYTVHTFTSSGTYTA